MSAGHLQELLGKPSNTDAYRERGKRTVCWYYGHLNSGRLYEACFKRWRLVSKARIG